MASRRKSRAYRIVSPQYPPFDYAGSHRWGSRWVSPGHWVVHGAETYALAVLENLVHWQSSTLPPDLVCVEVQIPSNVEHERLNASDVPDLSSNNYAATQELGDAWYERGETAVLWVPSAVSPYEANVLFNQRHEDFGRVIVGEPTPARLDPRSWSGN